MVTGAGSGIGRMVAERLLADGYTVLGSAVDRDEAAVLAERLAGDFTPFVVDVADADDVDRAAAVEAALGGRPLGALLNAAGITVNGPLVDLPPERFERLLAVNVVSTHAMTRALLPQLRRHPRPRVITMSSASGTRTMPFAGGARLSRTIARVGPARR